MSTDGKLEKPVGILLAGGRSSRMGCEKSLMDLAGRSLLRRAIDRLEGQVSNLVISANGDASRFDEFGLDVIGDTIPGHKGPLAGLLAGMKWAHEHSPDASHIVSIASDTPFFPLDLVSALRTAIEGRENSPEKTIAIPQSSERLHPAFGLWPVALADNLEDYLLSGEARVHGWLRTHEFVPVSFEAFSKGSKNMDPFFNINDQSDLETAMFWLENDQS
jgi:molybdenum cofactor guanylyltransferase